MIKLLEPCLPTAEQLLPWLRRIDESHWYSNFGPLEREWAATLARVYTESGLGDAQFVPVASATAGLQLALRALSPCERPRVLLPAFTFIASAQAVLAAGGEPILADIAADSWHLTPTIAEEALSCQSFDLVMPVATFGHPVDLAAWSAFALRHDILVLVDAASAFGNQKVGRAGVTVVFSFHATKVLSTGEGGAVVTDDAVLADTIRRCSNFGLSQTETGAHEVGINGKLSEYHAAVGLAALVGWEERREALVSLHETMLTAIARWQLPVALQSRAPQAPYAMFPFLLPDATTRAHAEEALTRANIQHRRWYYPPLHLHALFSCCQRDTSLECTGDIANRLLCIPYHLRLMPHDIETIMQTLKSALS